MKITSLSAQVRDKNRINVSIDGKYRFSLDISQVVELGLMVGKEYDEAQLNELEQESQFGKLYARALDFSMSRPHSQKELSDYLYKKTLSRKVYSKKTGKLLDIPGVPSAIADRVMNKILEKGYVDDLKFTQFWVENRRLRAGSSIRKLDAELRSKGVEATTISSVLDNSYRNDKEELKKVISKKAKIYDDPNKLKAYLVRLGFSYSDVAEALDET